MTELNPATFDVEAWLTDAALPEESATVYKRPDVVAELSDLKRRIDIETRVSDAEQSAASKRPAALEREYEQLLRTFSDSALTIFVRALTPDEQRSIRDAHEERTKDMAPADANREFGYDLLAAAIVGVREAGKEYVDENGSPVKYEPAKFTTPVLKAMRDKIGDVQMSLVLAARQQAQNGLPEVDADFLRKRSGTETGKE